MGKSFYIVIAVMIAAICTGMLSGCASLESKAVAMGHGVDAFSVQTAGSLASGTVLPNIIAGGAVSTIASAPVVAEGVETQVVFVRTKRNSFFGELFGIDASTESVSYIGAAGETAAETEQRLNAISGVVNIKEAAK